MGLEVDWNMRARVADLAGLLPSWQLAGGTSAGYKTALLRQVLADPIGGYGG